MNIRLYTWQEKCLQAWEQNNYRGIVQAVTGSGKTILALAAVNRLKALSNRPLHIKIVVPKTFMIKQWRQNILKNGDYDSIGCYYGSHKDKNTFVYMLYVINSARYSLARHILDDMERGYDILLIADECHHYASSENSHIFDFIPCLPKYTQNYYSLGLSATPDVYGYDSVLCPSLGNAIFNYSYNDALKLNTISRFVIMNIALSLTADESSEYDQISNRLTISINKLCGLQPSLTNLNAVQFFNTLKELANAPEGSYGELASLILQLSYKRRTLLYTADNRIICTYDLISLLDSHSKIIIFGERIEQLTQLNMLLTSACPGQTCCYHSQLGETARKNSLNRFIDGEKRILLCCRSLDEGFDIPGADAAIIISSASIERQRIQRLGRVLRRSSDKKIAALYYLYIRNSCESENFLPENVDGSDTLLLDYDVKTRTFINPDYAETMDRVLRELKDTNASDRQLTEARICMDAGLVKPDWLLNDADYQQKIDTAVSTHERNYWICMQKMKQMRQSTIY